MARSSSDSDSDHSSRYRRRRSRRSRSSNSDSSDSSSHRKRSSKHSKTKRRHRSNSRGKGRDRERAQKNYKDSRSGNSKDREKRRSSTSRDRSRSSECSKRKVRSTSREKSRSSSSSPLSGQEATAQFGTKITVSEKTLSTLVKDNFPIEARFKDGVLDEINAEGFAPKQFCSSNTKEIKFKNIVIDISADTIQTPTVTDIQNESESIFHSSIILDQDERFNKWVQKLYTLRQKAIADLIQSTVT